MASHEELLEILNAHGQQFLHSFSAHGRSKKRKLAQQLSVEGEEHHGSGLGSVTSKSTSPVAPDPPIHAPAVVVFADAGRQPISSSKTNRTKGFMVL